MCKGYRIELRGLEVFATAVPDGLALARGSDHAPLIAEVQR
jgi:hypothetical protein